MLHALWTLGWTGTETSQRLFSFLYLRHFEGMFADFSPFAVASCVDRSSTFILPVSAARDDSKLLSSLGRWNILQLAVRPSARAEKWPLGFVFLFCLEMVRTKLVVSRTSQTSVELLRRVWTEF